MMIAPEHLDIITGGKIVKVRFLLLPDIFECVYTDSNDELTKSINIPAGDIQLLLLDGERVVNQEQLLPFKEAIMRRLGKSV